MSTSRRPTNRKKKSERHAEWQRVNGWHRVPRHCTTAGNRRHRSFQPFADNIKVCCPRIASSPRFLGRISPTIRSKTEYRYSRQGTGAKRCRDHHLVCDHRLLLKNVSANETNANNYMQSLGTDNVNRSHS